MTPAAGYRGQPLVALLILLGGWTTVRAVAWDAQMPHGADLAQPVELTGNRPDEVKPTVAPAREPVSQAAAPMPFVTARAARLPAVARPVWSAATRFLPAAPPAAWVEGERYPIDPIPSVGPVARPVSEESPSSVAPPPYRDARWSGDAWLLLRRGDGGVSPAGGLAPPSYGASQAGAVLRYRLAPQSAHRPALHVRVSTALNGTREREAAFGVSARPIAGFPVTLAAEARVNGQPSGTHVRPAAFAYTELPPADLPLGMRAEFYGQAGYVGGNFASAFADGQLRLDRRFLRLGPGELRVGGGVWAGAQRDASRLDVGPTATVGLPLGARGGARLSADWRFRVAGGAAPDSGPAVTLSAGF